MDIKAAERELLARILVSMKNGRLSAVKAKQLAKQIVDHLPIDEDGLCEILDLLADQYQEARVVYIKYAIPYREEKRRVKIAQATGYLREGDVEKALKIIKS